MAINTRKLSKTQLIELDLESTYESNFNPESYIEIILNDEIKIKVTNSFNPDLLNKVISTIRTDYDN